MNRRPSSRFRPCLETLEDRFLPAVRFPSEFNGDVGRGKLTIESDEGGDVIRIEHNGAGHIRVTAGGVTKDFFNIQDLFVNANGGRDEVSFVQVGDAANPSGNQVGFLQVWVDLGFGDDTFTATLGGHTVQGLLGFLVAGQRGADTISIDARGVDVDRGARPPASGLIVRVLGGAGPDDVTLAYSGTNRGYVSLRADGKGPMCCGWNGGSSGNPGDGTEGDRDKLRIDATFRVPPNFRPAGRVRPSAELILSGDDDDNTLHLTLHGPTGFKAQIDGGAGRNTCVRTPNVSARRCGQDIVPGVSGPLTKVLGGRVRF